MSMTTILPVGENLSYSELTGEFTENASSSFSDIEIFDGMLRYEGKSFGNLQDFSNYLNNALNVFAKALASSEAFKKSMENAQKLADAMRKDQIKLDNIQSLVEQAAAKAEHECGIAAAEGLTNIYEFAQSLGLTIGVPQTVSLQMGTVTVFVQVAEVVSVALPAPVAPAPLLI